MSILPGLDDPRPRVDPPYLVIRNLTALPQRCIKTNEPISDAEYEVFDLPYIPRWLVFLMFMGGPIFLLTAPFVRQRCKVKAGLSKRIRRRRLLWRLFMIILILSPIFALAALVITRSLILGLIGPVTFALTYFTIPVMILHSRPLRIRRQEQGLFWITGCSSPFLTSLKQEFESM